MSASESADPTYTVFIRLPFARGDFVDPPAVNWDATKDKALWKVLSKASKNSDVDWNVLATKFDVTLPFLLQQAAWLYERQFSQVRAQLRKVGAAKVSSPTSGSEATGAEPMRRTGSGGGGVPRVPSSLSLRKESPLPRNEPPLAGASVRSNAPPMSRTSSASTTVQTRQFLQISPRLAKAAVHRPSTPPTEKTDTIPPSSSEETSSSSSSSSESQSEPAAKSRMLRRPPRFASRAGRSADNGDGEGDDDDDPPFLPFSTAADTHPHDPSATLKEDPRVSRKTIPKKSEDAVAMAKSQTSDSSASSAAPRPAPRPTTNDASVRQRVASPLSPRRTAELSGRAGGGGGGGASAASGASRGKGLGVGREGSDGSPSMGSSFSDLDDTSVTQSALEEALASKLQGGGMASRMSTISQALRSRYL